MAFIDYYKILGVDKNIDQKDVKKAYLKRAKQFHPDLHPNDPKAKAKFQALNEAYDVIGDPEKRRKYDQFGEQWRDADAFGGASGYRSSGGGGSPFDGFDFSSFRQGGEFSSFFQDLFGGGFSSAQAQHRQSAPMETQASMNISLRTALLGGDVVVGLSDGKKLKLRVKAGTQPGQKMRLRGKGEGGQDLIITMNVQLPTNLTDSQKALIEQALG